MRSGTLKARIAMVALITVAGIVWQVAALHIFAAEAGPMRGMIANPRPLDYVNYDYTPHGRRIAFWALTVPVSSTGLLLVTVGAIGTVAEVRSGAGKRAILLWLCIIGGSAAVAMVTLRNYLIAINFFI